MATWVESGGRLLLIADHMPLAGSAAKLAAAFGASFTDGFAYKAAPAGANDATTTAMRAPLNTLHWLSGLIEP